MFCPGCGTEVRTGGSFCGACGEPLEAPHAHGVEPEMPHVPPETPDRRRSLWLIGGSGLVVLGAALAVVLFLAFRGPDIDISGRLVVGSAPVEQAEVRAIRDGEIIGRTGPDPEGQWRLSVPESGTYEVVLAPGSLPDDLVLRNPSERTRRVIVEEEGRTVTFDLDELQTFEGDWFRVEYPSSWAVDTADLPTAGEFQDYFDTSIRRQGDPNLLIRIDALPNTPARTPRELAMPVVEDVRQRPGYEELRLEPTEFATRSGRYGAMRWEFRQRSPDTGVPLQKTDILFLDGSDGYAVLTQAPASTYPDWEPIFDRVRRSIRLAP